MSNVEQEIVCGYCADLHRLCGCVRVVNCVRDLCGENPGCSLRQRNLHLYPDLELAPTPDLVERSNAAWNSDGDRALLRIVSNLCPAWVDRPQIETSTSNSACPYQPGLRRRRACRLSVILDQGSGLKTSNGFNCCPSIVIKVIATSFGFSIDKRMPSEGNCEKWRQNWLDLWNRRSYQMENWRGRLKWHLTR